MAVKIVMPTLQFGVMMAVMLTVGFSGNVLLLPSLLAGPPGAAIVSTSRLADLQRTDPVPTPVG